MTFEQSLSIINTIGIWFAGIGTFAAAGVALWLASRSKRVKLRIFVGIRLLLGHGNSEECLVFSITNIGERPVIINNIGWRVGKSRNRKDAIQTLSHSSQDRIPKKIEYGENATFMINFTENPNWAADFVEKVILSEPVKSIRAIVFTSVGHIEEIKPEQNLLTKLQEVQADLKNQVKD